ncbi:MAG: thiamine pyrophosphate-dependent enzyme, partial [Veillonella parvula]
MTTAKDYRNDIRPNWCPGCGHYGVQAAITDAVVAKNIPPEKLAVISGIGCSSRIGGYFYAYGAHTTHGRALPYAQGVKLANQDLEVIAFSGDGDAFAIGMGHTIHAFKRNVNMTYVVMDNQLYALTKGQMSPKSDEGLVTTTTLEGVMEKPLSAMKIALSCEVTFLAQAFTGDMKEMMQIFEEAVNHDGF